MSNELICGTECKLKITLPEIDGSTQYEYNFDVEIYVNPKKKLTINRDFCFPIEGQPSKFIVPFDTADVGVGELNVEMVIYVPDDYFADKLRTERVRVESVTTIIP